MLSYLRMYLGHLDISPHIFWSYCQHKVQLDNQPGKLNLQCTHNKKVSLDMWSRMTYCYCQQIALVTSCTLFGIFCFVVRQKILRKWGRFLHIFLLTDP
jgi:hypothetical protein